MQSCDEEFASALEAPHRTPAHSTRLGGVEVGRQVQSWKVERAYNTDLPEALRAFNGSSSAQLEVQLGGTSGAAAPQLYSAWAPRGTGDVARPGQSVVHAAGVSGRTLPAFRGTVRSRTAASGSDTVTVQALDGAERLRGPALLPRPYHGYLYGRPVATEVWCVDELLRQGGIHTCPPPRAPAVGKDVSDPFTVLYASLHGGFNASHGQPETLPSPASYDWIRDGAPYEMALMPRAANLTASWMPRSRFVVQGKVFQAECWVNTALAKDSLLELKLVFDRSAGAYGHYTAVFDISTGTIKIHSGTLGGTGWYFSWTFSKLAALRGTWHLGFAVDTRAGGTGVLATVKPRLTAPDGQYLAGTPATYTDPSAAQPASELYRVDLRTDMAVECLQVTDRSWPDLDSYNRTEWEQTDRWRKGAVLDLPTVPLYDVPKVSGSQWEALSEIARATMSTAEFDEQGLFRWRGPARFAAVPDEPDLTVTTRRSIAALTVSEEIDACRNYCAQPYQDWTGIGFVHGEAVVDTLVREIKPGIPVEVAYAVAEEESDIGPLEIVDDAAPATGHTVRFGTAATGGASVKGSVTVSARRDGPSYVVRFVNHGSSSVWTVTKDGKPSVRILPIRRNADPKQRTRAWWNSTSQSYYGKQQYIAPASDWVQSATAASDLSHRMLDAGRYPVPLLGEVDVLHDPRIQLGDAVRVIDTAGAALSTLAWVVGIRTTCQAGAAPQQTLTLRGTAYNGAPLDIGLTPDAPLDPLYGTQRTYVQVTAEYATFDALTNARLSYRDLLIAPVPAGGTS
ncbi:hypothetical protein HW130_11830 [Streptomyces sp. PKU-EA00015]|uniref:hypothetical protein n=1 Tax=Streptomyces sp. PKU-EA00015 TaxID=2748326 RepID=UPI0015A12292|nr:hypothetical protein [Streptomyces sp. PKU-EA00015]NWF26951.1 hypothetical protein [Streptomyces sp. PKU-EA00015]